MAVMSSVDVFVPCYRYGRYLATCVESVLSQRDVDVRVLILDDASPDETEAVGRALARADGRVEYRRHTTNIGHIATYNEGLEWAAAPYNMLLSADDVLTAGALARAAQLMDANPAVTLVFGPDVPFSSEEPPRLPASADVDGGWRIWPYREFLATSCDMGHTPVMAATAVARTSTHKRIGGYLADHPHSGDTEVWLRLAAQGAVGSVDAPQGYRRVHGRNMSFDYGTVRRLAEHKKAFDEHFRLHTDVEHFRDRIDRTLAHQSFWLATRAFEAGDLATCEAGLAFAQTTFPAIRNEACWVRFDWKRRLGPRTWRAIRPVVELLRNRSEPAAATIAGSITG
jgi:glycosyltransferase involved in cell wall biosynthesis